jgi:hypothetical protein
MRAVLVIAFATLLAAVSAETLLRAAPVHPLVNLAGNSVRRRALALSLRLRLRLRSVWLLFFASASGLCLSRPACATDTCNKFSRAV